MPDIQFYCGLNERTWNHHEMDTGSHVCIAPVYGRSEATKSVNRVYVDPERITEVLVDSAAFSDKIELHQGGIVRNGRLSFEQALHRQIAHAFTYGYVEQVRHVASYDLLIDETWLNGERSKIRWSRASAEYAVRETVEAARYLVSQRARLRGIFGHPVGLALSAQGVEVEQYVRCAEQIVSLMEEGDIFGLGGWCITGLQPSIILPAFRDIIPEVISHVGSQGVKRVHIWGVIFPEALGHLLYLCNQHGIQLSTDSSGPCRYPVMGNWGYGSWRNNAYKTPPILSSCKEVDAHGNKAPTCLSDTYCRGLERSRHVQLTREWLAQFRTREPGYYRPVIKPSFKQDFLFDVA